MVKHSLIAQRFGLSIRPMQMALVCAGVFLITFFFLNSGRELLMIVVKKFLGV